jgi:hypothetical protein
VKAFFLSPALALITFASAQTANEATLTFVVADEINQIDIDLDVSLIGASNATSVVTGTMEVRVNIDPATATTDELTILSAEAAASDVELSRRNFLTGRYDLTARDITFSVSTPNEPGEVDPVAGTFDASQYEASTTGGTVSGTASNPLLGALDVPEVSLADPPFTGSAEGTGSITITPGRIEGRRLYFDLQVDLPVGFADTAPIPDLPVEVNFALAGELQATGETFLEFPDYPAWAGAQELLPDSENEGNLDPSVPNYFFYVLGFDDASAPAKLFEFGPDGITLQTGSAIALDEFEIQWSDDLASWTPVPTEAMQSGQSRFQFGDSLAEPPTLARSTTRKYLRLARP